MAWTATSARSCSGCLIGSSWYESLCECVESFISIGYLYASDNILPEIFLPSRSFFSSVFERAFVVLLRFSLPAFSSLSRGFFLAGSSKPHLRSSEYSITRILDNQELFFREGPVCHTLVCFYIAVGWLFACTLILCK